MKKIYKSPVITIVKVGPMLMADTSVAISSTKYNGATIESRRGGSLWDDDEE